MDFTLTLIVEQITQVILINLWYEIQWIAIKAGIIIIYRCEGSHYITFRENHMMFFFFFRSLLWLDSWLTFHKMWGIVQMQL